MGAMNSDEISGLSFVHLDVKYSRIRSCLDREGEAGSDGEEDGERERESTSSWKIYRISRRGAPVSSNRDCKIEAFSKEREWASWIRMIEEIEEVWTGKAKLNLLGDRSKIDSKNAKKSCEFEWETKWHWRSWGQCWDWYIESVLKYLIGSDGERGSSDKAKGKESMKDWVLGEIEGEFVLGEWALDEDVDVDRMEKERG
jgi:hypothetical protein